MKESDERFPANYTLSPHSSQNITGGCAKNPRDKVMIVSLYLVPLVLGQPMSMRRLWLSLSSKHLDVLNCNLALFHLLQYCFVYAQLSLIFTGPHHENLYKFIFVYIQVGGPMQLCFICLERFMAVIHPTYFPLLKKYRCRETCAAVVWTLSLTFACNFNFNANSQSVERVARFLPASLMAALSWIVVFTSVKVAKVLRKPVGKDSIHPTKRRAFITICVTSAAAMSLYLPVMVMERFYVSDRNKYQCTLFPWCIFFLSTASLVHPLFYLYARRKFRCGRCTKRFC